jgi:hypothetical protein
MKKEGIGKKELSDIVYHNKQTEEMRLTQKGSRHIDGCVYGFYQA